MPSSRTSVIPGTRGERLRRRRRAEPHLDGVPGLLPQPGHGFQHQQAAGPDDGDPVRDPFHLRQHVRGQQHRGPGLHALPQDRSGTRPGPADPGRWSAHRATAGPDRRAARAAPRPSGGCPWTARRRAGPGPRPAAWPDRRSRCRDPGPRSRARWAAIARAVIFGHSRTSPGRYPVRACTARLSRQQSRPCTRADPAGRPQVAHQHAHGRGLPGAVRPEKAEYLPGPDLQAEPVQRQHPPVTLTQRFGLDHDLVIVHPRHPPRQQTGYRPQHQRCWHRRAGT